MAPRRSRRRHHADDTPDGRGPDGRGPDGDVDLGAAEHAWWAGQDINGPWTGPTFRLVRHRDPALEEDKDVLAEHLGASWRTDFGYEQPAPAEDAPEPEAKDEDKDEDEAKDEPLPPLPADTTDPYVVLGVAPSVPWSEIVDAHRTLARRHHPDRFFGADPTKVAAAEEHIRIINTAYQQLRIRRDK